MSVPGPNPALGELLQRPDLWRGTPASAPSATALPTGHAALDALLPGGGWPLGALTELCHAHAGMGELRVIMPALAQLTRARRWVALVGAPHPFHATALAAAGLDLERVVVVDKEERGGKRGQSPFPRGGFPGLSLQEKGSDPFFPPDPFLLWAAEQALRSGACGAVVVWPQRIDDRGLRRLQLAAEAGRNWGVALRPLAAGAQASPAALRLQVESGPRVRILKCRGATRPTGITVSLSRNLPAVGSWIGATPQCLLTPPQPSVHEPAVHAPTKCLLTPPQPSPNIGEGDLDGGENRTVDLIPARGFALPAPRRIPPVFPQTRTPHALAGARISAPGTGCPR